MTEKPNEEKAEYLRTLRRRLRALELEAESRGLSLVITNESTPTAGSTAKGSPSVVQADPMSISVWLNSPPPSPTSLDGPSPGVRPPLLPYQSHYPLQCILSNDALILRIHRKKRSRKAAEPSSKIFPQTHSKRGATVQSGPPKKRKKTCHQSRDEGARELENLAFDNNLDFTISSELLPRQRREAIKSPSKKESPCHSGESEEDLGSEAEADDDYIPS